MILHIFVYQMVRLCGGAHEISGIKAPLFLHAWVVGWDGVGLGWVEWLGGWDGVGLVGDGVCGILVRDVVGGG